MDGRMNIIIEELGKNSTQITVNTRYILTKNTTVYDIHKRSQTINDTISFNSGQQSMFPNYGQQGTLCQCNGKFEKEILSLLSQH